MPGRLSLLLLILLLVSPLPQGEKLGAQEEVTPVLEGQVRAGDDPLPDVWVVLHRVSRDFSGEVDSVRTRGDGSFRMELPRLPDHGVSSEVFFASVRYRNLLYFGPALTSPTQLDSLYLVQAYDTLSVPPGGAPLPVSHRTLFLSKTSQGWDVTDVFQLSQDEGRTLFSPEEGMVWSYPLPAEATGFEVGQSDLVPEDTRFQDGFIRVFSPIPPGERIYLFRYSIPSEEFAVPLGPPIRQMEVLMPESVPEMEVLPLTRGMPVEMQPGEVFRRFEGTNLQDGAVELRLLPQAFRISAEWMGILLATLLGGFGVFAYRLRSRDTTAPTREGMGQGREKLLLAIAELDEAFQRKGDPSPGERQAYQSSRRNLLARLKDLG